jgi:hypothetical protein
VAMDCVLRRCRRDDRCSMEGVQEMISKSKSAELGARIFRLNLGSQNFFASNSLNRLPFSQEGLERMASATDGKSHENSNGNQTAIPQIWLDAWAGLCRFLGRSGKG